MLLPFIISALTLTSPLTLALTNALSASHERLSTSTGAFSKSKRAQDPSVYTYSTKDPENDNLPVNFTITVPQTLTVGTWNETLLANLKTNLPGILKQLYVDPKQIPALVEEGLPDIFEALTSLQSGLSLPDVDSDLVRRGLFSKIGRWIKKASACPIYHHRNDNVDK